MAWTRFDNGCEVWWDEEHGLARLTHHHRTHDQAQARENIEAVARLCHAQGRTKVGLLVDIRKLQSIDRPARLLYASDQAASMLLAGALWTDSVISRVLANFFLNFTRPPVPYRMFDESKPAIEWLATFDPRRDAAR